MGLGSGLGFRVAEPNSSLPKTQSKKSRDAATCIAQRGDTKVAKSADKLAVVCTSAHGFTNVLQAPKPRYWFRGNGFRTRFSGRGVQTP